MKLKTENINNTKNENNQKMKFEEKHKKTINQIDIENANSIKNCEYLPQNELILTEMIFKLNKLVNQLSKK